MTVPVPDQLEYISDADGVTKDFSYPKRFLQKDEIVVLLRDADGVDTPQILNTHYTIAGSSWPSGGTISFITAPQAPNKIVRYRMTQAKQTVDLENNQRNDAPSVETQLDRLTMAIQDRGGISDRAWWGLKQERAERIAGDAALNERVDQEIIDRENGDLALSSLIGQAGEIEVPMYDTRLAVTFGNIKSTINAIRTGGYSVAGDGGAALYMRVPTEPTHAGKVQSADGAWWELAETEPNVKMFGANMDGSVETSALQSAVDYCVAKKAHLIIPNGEIVSSTINVNSSLEISGSGTIRLAPDVIGHIIAITGVSSVVKIKGITLDGDHAGRAALGKISSVHFGSVGSGALPSRLDIDGVTFLNGNWADIIVTTDPSFRTAKEEISIENCRFLRGREGTTETDDCRSISISSPVLAEVRGNVFDMVDTPSLYGRCAVEVFDGHGSGDSKDNGARTVISDNIFFNMGRSHPSSALGAVDLYTAARDVIITNNIFLASFACGIATKSDAYNLVISNNVLDGLSALTGGFINSLIVVNRSKYASVRGNVTITGNSLNSSDAAGITVVSQNLAGDNTGTGYTIVGNTVRGCATRGIYANLLQSVTIANNHVRGGQIGIAVDSATRQVNITGNEVGETTSSSIYAGTSMASASISILGNVINNPGNYGVAVESSLNASVVGNLVSGTSGTALRLQNVTGILNVRANTSNLPTPLSMTGNSGIVSFSDNCFTASIGTSARLATIASGAIRASLDWMLVDTQASASSDDLDNILGGADGDIVTLRPNSTARVVTVKNATGNIICASDFALNSSRTSITLRRIGANWYEISRTS
nr:right-handed parallel beta-helix repeat-containing protein [Brucella intermedia]